MIGAVLVPGAKAPVLIEREDLKLMKPGSVIIDVAIDQGGCVATSRPTTHSNPTFVVDDVVHYCVANMPGAVGRTSTFALCNVTLPWALQIANRGLPAAAEHSAAGGPGDQHLRGRSDQPGRCRDLRHAVQLTVRTMIEQRKPIRCRSRDSMPETTSPLVGIVMGSDSDWPKIKAAAAALDEFGVPYEVRVMSAHRTPEVVRQYAAMAAARGLKVIIAAAGGAAHLAGVVASHTTLPVIGIPVPTELAGGLDSLLSIVQMPGDVPVATVGVGGGGPRNAGLLAVADPRPRRRRPAREARRLQAQAGREGRRQGRRVAGDTATARRS